MGSSGTTHLIKLAVGVDDVAHLQRIQEMRRAAARAEGRPPVARHVTRSRPKRADDVLAGGCMFWVIRGLLQARQRIVSLEEVVGEDGIPRCAIGLDDELVRLVPRPCRPFQGWRYLAPAEAPPDLGEQSAGEEMPPELLAELRELGLL